ncbi:MAG: hypothetical protein M3Y85_12550, partial [Bacteroidota bacterium]|nr:hypothetical protein [Bacteroidota bacterium]
MRRLLPLLLFIIATSAYAQQPFDIKGIIEDSLAQPISGVSVRLHFGKDSALSITGKTGTFSFFKVTANSFTII